mmetsp:Transcript_16434/g.49065  ORF Transcript_16434/g.49065 Transcript_16434/m.49065 type:complete len:106 (-) Transcript_16434:20-337(-)
MPPRIRISKTILWQGSWMLLPGLMCYVVMKPNQSTGDLEDKLRRDYGRNVRQAQAQRDNLKNYFEHMRTGENAELEKKMAGTMQGGGKTSVAKPTYDERYRPKSS